MLNAELRASNTRIVGEADYSDDDDDDGDGAWPIFGAAGAE